MIPPRLSVRAQSLEPSATLAMAAKAKALQDAGHPVIAFTVGEPDFRTPAHICAAAKEAIDQGMHKYTPVPGIPALRQAVAARLKESIGVEYAPTEIVVSPGAKYSIHLAFQALLSEGDEALIPAPHWVSYPEMARLSGAKPVIIETREEDGFALTARAVEAAITPRTKLLVLNSPGNPTGGITPPDEIDRIAAVLERRGVWCVSDEIYDCLIYGGAALRSPAAVSPWNREHTIVINGVSKTYAMTGWRIGWAAGPKDILKAMDDLQSQSTSNPCSISQAAAVAALTGPQDSVADMRKAFEARRAHIMEQLAGIPGIACGMPAGAFYAFPNIQQLLGKTYDGVKVETPTDFCMAALEKVHVAMVAGEPFGSPRHVRLSYACSMEQITEGCRRLKEFAAKGRP